MQTWEYHIFPWDDGTTWSGDTGVSGAKTMLNHFGADRWELVNAVEEKGATMFYFKRRVAPERSGVVTKVAPAPLSPS